MKKILYIAILLISNTLMAQDRDVFWVHGLGDNANFWDKQYSRRQINFQIRSYSKTYTTADGVQNYANRIRLDRNAPSGERTIAVGHSLGGLAIRQACKDDNDLYGGVITLGSPLDGARIANAVRNGASDKFITHSTEILASGPIAAQCRNDWQRFWETIGGVLVADRAAGTLIRTYASATLIETIEGLTGGFQEQIVNQFNPSHKSIQDLAENSTYIQSIRDFESDQPKIFAWGNEDSPVHIRLFVSSVTRDVNYAANILTAYNTLTHAYQCAANSIRIRDWHVFWGTAPGKRRRKAAWNAGADYLRRGWETEWNILIGAQIPEIYTHYSRIISCATPITGKSKNGRSEIKSLPPEQQLIPFTPEDNSVSGNNPVTTRRCVWVTKTERRTRWLNGSSDGLIKRYSQVARRSRWNSGRSNERVVELKGVNHLEMGVHEETDQLFEEAFRGRHGRYFYTNRR